MRIFLKSFMISMMCCAVFVGAGYYYLNSNFQAVENEAESVPYTQENPQNAGLMLKIGEGRTFFYLDFENEKLFVSLKPEVENNEIYGYEVDYTITADIDILRDAVDYLGGIEMSVEGDVLRYTGIQVCSIYVSSANGEIKGEILEKICEKVAHNGVALDFFANIIENSQTDLTIPDCYFWDEEIQILCRNLQIID